MYNRAREQNERTVNEKKKTEKKTLKTNLSILLS
jgi:hypothetical protein